MADYIHGGTDLREVARLGKQALVWVAPRMLGDFTASPGMRVLDLGTGVGAMAAVLARRHAGIELWGLDLRAPQLLQARALHPVARYVQGDAARMPFPDASFDRVHATWVLEHIPDVEAVLREVRRVLVPGGQCFFLEVDNATLELAPPSPHVFAALEALNRAQVAAGGDPYVGQKLDALLRRAGFSEVRVRSLDIVGNAADPETLRSSADELAEIFDSLDEALGPEQSALLHAAAAEARALPVTPGAEFRYRPVSAVATR
ncbi:MAG TPA: methyltransferase domain-containing protein [Myxococcaceae bacterium]|jgi:ubiquinone/menaquinone biosynthesis C-methylase UbiE|nr:methyltransferase domain-containing protein [Myxococcaceae bacterium]